MAREKRRSKLSVQESEQLGVFLWKNRNVIRKIINNCLGKQFDYLLEDCEGEVLLIAVEHGVELLEHQNPVGWLVLTSKNIASNARRKEIARMKNTSDTFPEQIHKQENLFEEVVFENWIKDEVTQELLSHLTTREREIYELMFVKALSTKEICEQLQITESTVRNTKKNIMDKIKKDIEDHNFNSV